jgi:hypothetical protein
LGIHTSKLSQIPSVRNTRWVRNPIDAFVLTRIEREGITPSPEADRRTLIRRLSLDLIGLPPTPEQVRAFVADTRPDAYERLVDSLLASPHFGERWARHWLDVARYADTSGYQIDRPRPFAYMFRDWVIDAFNDDMPFDQFTIEQLAGTCFRMPASIKDCRGLPPVDVNESRRRSRCRGIPLQGQGGSGQHHWRDVARADPRLRGVSQPQIRSISQREFYQFYAFFNNSEEVDMPVPQANDPARLEREQKAWTAEQTRLKGLLADLVKSKDGRVEELKRLLARHRRSQPKKLDAQAMTFQERTNAARAGFMSAATSCGWERKFARRHQPF